MAAESPAVEPGRFGLAGLLEELVGSIGAREAAALLALSPEQLVELRSGSGEWTPELLDRLELACAPLGLSRREDGWVEGEQEGEYFPAGESAAAEFLDDGQTPRPAEADSPVGCAVQGQRWVDVMEQRRYALWHARTLAVLFQFRMGVSYANLLDAFEVVTRLELALIMTFHDSVPEPGVDWDLARRAREIETRMARLRWVERERDQEYRGVMGALKRFLIGDRRGASGKDLYQRMLQEAERMIRGGAEPPYELQEAGGRSRLSRSGRALAGPARSRDGSPVAEAPPGGGVDYSLGYPDWLLEEDLAGEGEPAAEIAL